MSVKKFRFVSPGVFINEIDNSGIPASPAGIGPVVVGRAKSGPGLRPVTVNSFSEFVNVFGAPVPGGSSDDIWRDGNTVGPTYGMYAAQAYLRNSAPLTYVRLMGAESDDATSAGKAGWKVSVADSTSGQGAYGLVIFPSSSNPSLIQHDLGRGALAAIFYVPGISTDANNCSLALSGTAASSSFGMTGSSTLIQSVTAGSNYEFKMIVRNATGSSDSTMTFNFDRSSDRYIRKVFNTNPQLSNRDINSNVANYWLGPTFDRHLVDTVTAGASSNYYGAIVPMLSGTANAGDYQTPLLSAQTPWIISQDLTDDNSNYSPANMQKLFKVIALDEPGAWTQRNIKISIQDIKASTNDFQPYGSFSVVVRKLDDTDNVVEVLEQFNDCNLNPNSLNYVARKIGDRYRSWDSTNKRYRVYGQYDNNSRYVRIDMNTDVDNGVTDAKFLPFGNLGVVKYKDFTWYTTSVMAGGTWGSVAGGTTTGVDSYIAPSGSAYLPGSERGATATVTWYTGDRPEAGDTITIIDAAGVSKEYLAAASQNLGTDPPRWHASNTTTTQVDSLQSCIESANGHNGSIIVSQDATGLVMTLTQSTAGASGNTTITVAGATSGQISATNFSRALPGYGEMITSLFPHLTGAVAFPQPALRGTGSDGGLGNYTDAYWGYQTGRSAAPLRFDESNLDLLYPLGALGSSQFATAAGLELSTAFTLDDLSGSGTSDAVWAAGYRFAGTSLSAAGLNTWSSVLDAGWDRFTVPMHGGFDGLDVTESEPFRNNAMVDSTEFTSYANHSIKRAIDSLADPEMVEMNLATMPGLTNEGLTAHLINTCEDRADAMAIIDLKGGYVPKTENSQAFSDRVGSTATTLSNLKARGLNSSYGCAYYPWVQIRDTINGALLWVPPSVAAIGTFSSSQRKSQVWFAPAGFNRGGLTVGAAGVPVVNVVEKLTRQQRDDLYAVNINPIAKFPAEGIVIFGQKTLQITQSALDRINVRRLMIFVKKRISQIASQLLFEPNVQQTWDRFVGQVTPFLDEVKTNFGLSDYLLVLDDTTTTPDLIDRNILYAQIFLKPTRAIEFIALDFNITRTGASFVD